MQNIWIVQVITAPALKKFWHSRINLLNDSQNHLIAAPSGLQRASVAEKFIELVEAVKRVATIAGYRIANTGEGLLFHRAALGIELVGIANELFKHRHRAIVLDRQVKILKEDILLRDTGAGVTFRNARPRFGSALAPQQFAAYDSVAHVGRRAMTVDAGRVSAENADIMEHRRSLDIEGIKTDSPRQVDGEG